MTRRAAIFAMLVAMGLTACSTTQTVTTPPRAQVKMMQTERAVQASQGIPGTNNENSPL